MAKEKDDEAPKTPTPNGLPENEPDIKERIDGFNGELLPLLGKYELGLAALPRLTQDGRVVADPIIVSVRGRPEAQPSAEEAPAPAVPDQGLTKSE